MRLRAALADHWPEYLMEAAELGKGTFRRDETSLPGPVVDAILAARKKP